MANVKLEHISKIYPGGYRAVDAIDLEIKDREFMVLVGPSGCGKTTTLRMIAGLEAISEGDLYIGSRRVNEMPSKDRAVAMVFQNYALFPHMTIYENIAFGLKRLKTPKPEMDRRIHRAAEMLNMEALLDRKPDQLSGGQKQRVALGRALVMKPTVFLMDEPLSNLDAKLRVQMRTELIKLHQELEATFIYVTHDQTEAMTMGTRICVMKDGLIQQVDTPRNIYEYPANIFVASFIGAPQINMLEGVLVKTENSLFIEVEDLRLKLPKAYAGFEPYINQEVLIGIRPEAVAIGRETTGSEFSVELTELLGSDMNVYLRHGGINLISKLSGHQNVDKGDRLNITIETASIHLFDKEHGTRISKA